MEEGGERTVTGREDQDGGSGWRIREEWKGEEA